MGTAICRLNDVTQGFCKVCSKTIEGRISSSSDEVKVNGRGVARHGDIVMSDCGHPGTIKAQSTTVKVNGKAIAKVGDLFDGSYSGILKDGSSDAKAG